VGSFRYRAPYVGLRWSRRRLRWIPSTSSATSAHLAGARGARELRSPRGTERRLRNLILLCKSRPQVVTNTHRYPIDRRGAMKEEHDTVGRDTLSSSREPSRIEVVDDPCPSAPPHTAIDRLGGMGDRAQPHASRFHGLRRRCRSRGRRGLRPVLAGCARLGLIVTTSRRGTRALRRAKRRSREGVKELRGPNLVVFALDMPGLSAAATARPPVVEVHSRGSSEAMIPRITTEPPSTDPQ